MKWGWTTSFNNLESVLPLQDTFNNYLICYMNMTDWLMN